MDIDRAFRMVYEALNKKAIRWNDFRPVGVDEDYHDWYYAEDRLYVIRDRIFQRLTLIEANSPADAWRKLEEEVECVFGGGECDE